jgi:hypothetical protein
MEQVRDERGIDQELVTTALTRRIDEALKQFTARELVTSAEVVDLLLDLRLMLLASETRPQHVSN